MSEFTTGSRVGFGRALQPQLRFKAYALRDVNVGTEATSGEAARV